LPYFSLVSNHRPQARLPMRADPCSAGYDFFLPENIVLHPGDVKLVYIDVKAYMDHDEVLLVAIRSSLAKNGIFLANAPGVIDASYYNNPSNEGNIGLLLYNATDRMYHFCAGDRVAQGIFVRYLTVTGDRVISDQRTGGHGSSGA